jgi:hypothetical protein
MRRVSANLVAMVGEKQKVAKAATGKKKKGSTLKFAQAKGGDYDLTDYGGGGGGDRYAAQLDDFI